MKPLSAKQALLKNAKQAQANAYSPYSHFSVGAAIETKEGAIYSGANVENASFGATICAERSAILAAVSAGKRQFKAMAVVSSGDTPPIPCGACLQVLAEFCSPSFRIYLATESKLSSGRSLQLKDLLPETFTFER